MRILIDECVDPRVKLLFDGHQPATVYEKGWDTFEDGPLLALGQREFDVFLTIDQNLEFQQNLAKFQIGVVVVHVPKNQMVHYQAVRKELRLAVANARRGRLIHVIAPPVSSRESEIR